jgi:hypothetical protein
MITRTIHDETETETEPSGYDAYCSNLTHRTTESTPAEAEPLDGDGQPLAGYDAYCFNLTHRKTKAASDGKGGR